MRRKLTCFHKRGFYGITMILFMVCILPTFAKAEKFASLPKNLPPSKAYLKAMCSRLTSEDSSMLSRIHEPIAVAVPPANARAYVCMMPDGEIRAYGRHFMYETDTESQEVYLSSYDCGLSWKYHLTEGIMRTATFFPEYGLWAKAFQDKDDGGLYVYTSTIGPDDKNPHKTLVSKSSFNDIFLPVKLENSNRCYFTCQNREGDVNTAAFVYTDDAFKTFHVSMVEQPKWRNFTYPHKGLRWCVGYGSENYVCPLDSSKLLMIQRTPDDWFYQSFSYDKGTTWSTPEPSPFHGTDTTPFLLSLSDGRILMFWNNTRPLPELDHHSLPDVTEGILNGRDEDFFTNRDAAHVAISDDGGKTWKGARELCLNDIRNNPDFRLVGNPLDSRDKSVHQFQAFELPYNKVLVAVGQNEASRRLLIFDVDWLYENERHEDFRHGLSHVSTHVFVKSYAGYTPDNGHCAYNRTNGALLTKDPVVSRSEVVQLARVDDPRLVSQTQGLVWNFPVALKGSVSVELMLAQDSIDISFDDCWSNPCDEYEPELSLFSFRLDDSTLSPGVYHKLNFSFDVPSGKMEMFVDGTYSSSRTIRHNCPLGLSYINIQCRAAGQSEGCYIKRLDSFSAE